MRYDFGINVDPEIDDELSISKKIIYSIIVKKIKNNKPVFMFIGGDTGEGKSLTAVSLQQIFFEAQGIYNYIDFLEICNVFKPREYPEKLRALLYDKAYKKINAITIHETRIVAKAKAWHSYINQAIADISNTQRSIKRLFTILISQFIRDIDLDLRYLMTYYCEVWRPQGGQRAQLYIYRIWKDTRDIEKPVLRKRRITGLMKFKNGKIKLFSPKCLKFKLPELAIKHKVTELDREGKIDWNKRTISKLIKEMYAGEDLPSKRIDSMVEHYVSHPDALHGLIKKGKKKIRFTKIFQDMHDLSKSDLKEIEEKYNIKKAIVP